MIGAYHRGLGVTSAYSPGGIAVSPLAKTGGSAAPAQATRADWWAAVQKLAPLIAPCSTIDCSRITDYTIANDGAWPSIIYPGMAMTWWQLLIPLPAFADLTKPVSATYVDGNSAGIVPLGQLTTWQRDGIAAAWRKTSTDRLNDVLAKMDAPTVAANRMLPMGFRAQPLPSQVLSLKTFLSAYPEFALTYADVATGVAPTPDENSKDGGLASYLSRAGWLPSTAVLGGQVSLDHTGVEACGGWCKSTCTSDDFPGGIPVCTQPIDLMNGAALYWNVFASRDKAGQTTVRLEPVMPSGLDEALKAIGNFINQVVTAVCSIGVPAAQASPNPYAQSSATVVGIACGGKNAPTPTPPPITLTPPPPQQQPPAETKWYQSPGFWVVTGTIAAAATGSYLLLGRR